MLAKAGIYGSKGTTRRVEEKHADPGLLPGTWTPLRPCDAGFPLSRE